MSNPGLMLGAPPTVFSVDNLLLWLAFLGRCDHPGWLDVAIIASVRSLGFLIGGGCCIGFEHFDVSLECNDLFFFLCRFLPFFVLEAANLEVGREMHQFCSFDWSVSIIVLLLFGFDVFDEFLVGCRLVSFK
jgi:hypothetical protein